MSDYCFKITEKATGDVFYVETDTDHEPAQLLHTLGFDEAYVARKISKEEIERELRDA